MMDLSTKVKKAGLRVTQPRLRLLELLSVSSQPLSFAQICETLEQQEIDNATIYRNLQKFVEKKIVHTIQQPGDVNLYSMSTHDHEHHVHPHFSCTSCKTVQCLPELSVKFKEHNEWDKALQNAVLHFSGVCPSCE